MPDPPNDGICSIPIATNLVTNNPPPIVHAIGGSIGSALSLLLLYPLERARIEMQSLAVANSKGRNRRRRRQSTTTDDQRKGVATERVNNNSSSSVPRGVQAEASCRDSPQACYEEDFRPPMEDALFSNVTSEIVDRDSCRENLVSYADSIVSSASRSSSSFEMISSNKSRSSSDTLPGHDETDDERSECSSAASHNNNEASSRSIEENDVDTATPTLGLWHSLLSLHERKELYKGATPIVFTIALSNFIFFYALQATRAATNIALFLHSNTVKNNNSSNGGSSSTSLLLLVASSLAGTLNVLVTNPLWVANLRIVQGNSPMLPNGTRDQNVFTVIKSIANTEGMGRLWSGTWASLFLVCNPAIQHFVYEHFKMELLIARGGENGPSSLRSIEAFVLGAMAKGIATIVTYPIQLAQVLLRLQRGQDKEYTTTDNDDEQDDSDKKSRSSDDPPSVVRMQSQTDHDDRSHPMTNERQDADNSTRPSYTGTLDCMIQLYKRGGIRAVYSGMNAKLLQTVLTAAFTFLTYEQILKVVTTSYMSLSSRTTTK